MQIYHIDSDGGTFGIHESTCIVPQKSSVQIYGTESIPFASEVEVDEVVPDDDTDDDCLLLIDWHYVYEDVIHNHNHTHQRIVYEKQARLEENIESVYNDVR